LIPGWLPRSVPDSIPDDLKLTLGFTELDPRNGDAFYDLGKALLQAGEAEAAVSALRRSVELRPTDPSPHYQLALELQKINGLQDLPWVS
jgi:tetratricopeptide (TPR) repeat protein